MLRITHNTQLQALNTFRLPASARTLVESDNADELYHLLSSDSLQEPIKTIGSGSNLLITGDIKGTLIRFTDDGITCSSDGIITAGAGATLDSVCAAAARLGLWGLENLSGIPGSAGGAAVQNAGAYGVETADCLTAVNTVSRNGLRRYSREDCMFGYRSSRFKHNPELEIITSVEFHLSIEPKPNLRYGNLSTLVTEPSPQAIRDAVLAIRAAKLPDPAYIGSAGSFFTNPVVSTRQSASLRDSHPDMPVYPVDSNHAKLSAAWLIDKAGCKSLSVGGAALWQSQPLVIVNASGQATAADIMSLSAEIQQKVLDTFGIRLTPEVETI